MSTMLTARLTTESGWHSIRGLTVDHNARRFRKHVERIGREPEMRRFMRATRLKKRRAARRRACPRDTRAPFRRGIWRLFHPRRR